ncbi:putative nuclease HARBI1 [Lineus longissimus]|uniref:putative nuclease HARBI1 n=1 Tax=Lineus longissimus TaxID=88925 RepID=UPI00315CDD2E
MAALMLAVQEEVARRRAFRRERVFRDRLHPLDAYNDLELYRRYRLDRETLLELIDAVGDELDPITLRNHALPRELKVLAALRFYGTGSFQILTGDSVQISQPTMCRVISQVTRALLALVPKVIKFPALDEIPNIVEEFHNIANFPSVLGLVDGTHVWILGPSQHEWRYINRKGYHSINTQVVMDAQYRFINVVAKWPGSTHDSVNLRESGLSEIMSRRDGEEILLGDSGYPVRPWLMTPFLNPETAAQRRYNKSHKKTRCLVERGIGQWKRWFNCLHGQLRYSPQKSCEIIAVCAALQNIAVNRGLPDFEDLPIEHQQPRQPQPDDDHENVAVLPDRPNGAAARNDIVNNHFQ